MKKRFFIIIAFVFVLTGFVLTNFLSLRPAETAVVKAKQQTAPELEPIAGGTVEFLPEDKISDRQREEIIAGINKNTEKLEREGKLAPATSELVPFSAVVRAAPGNNAFGVEAISNHVDHNLAFPNQVRDYNCGIRTYDTADGHNHQGTDIFPYPFWWKQMAENKVEVVAGAPGTIVFKHDGEFDRNCGGIPGGGNWNVVAVRHADNSHAWYGHLKSGSLTTKAVGQTVAAGEYIGLIGSSGPSTAPHLHLEIRINNQTTIQDPFQGACNLMNASSWWANQEPYRVSRINRLMTHSAPPEFPTCPNPEITNEKNTFRPGESVESGVYYRDQIAGQVSQLALIRPDGTVYHAWSHTAPQTASASYFIWYSILPTNAQPGTWKFRVEYNSQVYEHTFNVLSHHAFDFDGDSKTDISIFRPGTGEWWYRRSRDFTVSAVQFGTGADKLAPVDWSGDGKTDVTIWRPSTGEWYVLRSEDNSYYSFPFGSNGDIPAPADYDGDGLADPAVFRPSTGTWFIQRSTGGVAIQTFGIGSDSPVPADYDGDGKADIAIFRHSAGEWWHLKSSDGQARAVQFGSAADKTAQGDWTGDGKADQAFWRPSTGEWFVLRSEDSSFYSFPFGLNSDIPTPGDYDGDGQFDAAVFRPSSATWFVNRTTAGMLITEFGLSDDSPVPNAFVR